MEKTKVFRSRSPSDHRDQKQEESQSEGTRQWQREARREFWGRLIRWVIAIFLISYSFPWLDLRRIFLMALGWTLIASDIIGYIAQFAGRLLWPESKIEPQPLYSIAESLVAKGKYEEAEREYKKIIQEFPNEVKPHLDLISMAVVRLNNAELAEQFYLGGMNTLQDPAARETLTRMYAAIQSRLKSSDEKKRKVIPREKMEEIRAKLARDRQKLWQ